MLRFLFLIRQAKVVVAHLVRHGLSKSLFERVHCLVRAVARCGRTVDLGRAVFVVTHRKFRTGDVLDRRDGIERHRLSVCVANEKLADVLRVGPIIAFRFDVDLPGAAEAVEVIHKKAAHECLQRLINRGEIDALLDDFVAIDLDENLRNIRQKCRNQGAELRPFVRCLQKRLHVLGEKRDVFTRTIFEHKRESTRCSDAGNRRWRKRERDTFAKTA